MKMMFAPEYEPDYSLSELLPLELTDFALRSDMWYTKDRAFAQI